MRRRGRRVFLIGAGASHFAEFPLGTALWNFLKSHGSDGDPLIDLVEEYVRKRLRNRASRFLGNIELLLTGLDLRMWADSEIPTEQGGYSLQISPSKLRRKRKSQDPVMHRASSVQVQSKYVGLQIEDSATFREMLVERIATAFLMHHECLLWPRVVREAGDTPAPTLAQLASRSAGFKEEEAPFTVYTSSEAVGHEANVWINEYPKARAHRSHQGFAEQERIVCPCAGHVDYERLREVGEKIGRFFRPGDVLLSFNWDALFERFLWQHKLWSFRTGYGFPVEIERRRGRRKSYRLPKDSPVTLLKLHGSITWSAPRGGELGLPQLRSLDLLFNFPFYSTNVTMLEVAPSFDPLDPSASKYAEFGDWDQDYGRPATTMIYPTYTKDYSITALTSGLWRTAQIALSRADEVYVLGFSLPRGDSSARALIATGLFENAHRPAITVVNPGSDNWTDFASRLGFRLNREKVAFEDWILAQ